MPRLAAFSILGAAAAQELCDVCQGREMPPGALTVDGNDCSEIVPFCAEQPEFGACGGTCETVQNMIGTFCCPLAEPLPVCDICGDRPLIENAVIDGGHVCGGTVPFCNENAAACGGTCEDLFMWFSPTCCPPEPCDVCQGRPILDMMLESGYSCADTVGFCTNSPCGDTCEAVQTDLGGQCCPTAEQLQNSTSHTGNETHHPFEETKTTPPPAEEQPAEEQSAEEQPTEEQPTEEQPTQPTEEQPAEGEPAETEEQPTRQPAEPVTAQPAAAENEDGWEESGAVNLADGIWTAVMIMTLSSMLC